MYNIQNNSLNQITSQFLLENNYRLEKKPMEYQEFKKRNNFLKSSQQYENQIFHGLYDKFDKDRINLNIASNLNMKKDEDNEKVGFLNHSNMKKEYNSYNKEVLKDNYKYLNETKTKIKEIINNKTKSMRSDWELKSQIKYSKYNLPDYDDGSVNNNIMNIFLRGYEYDKKEYTIENEKNKSNQKRNLDPVGNKVPYKSKKTFEDKAYLQSIEKRIQEEKEKIRKPYLHSDPYLELEGGKRNFEFQFLEGKEVNYDMKEKNRVLTSKSNEYEVYNKDMKSVKDVYKYSNPNFEYQKTNEDYMRYIDNYNFINTDGLFMIFDGYQGFEIADYSINRFPEILSTYLVLHERNILKHNDKTFKRLPFSSFPKEENKETNKLHEKRPFEYNEIENILIKSIKKIDFETQTSSNTECGSTGVVAYFTIEKEEVYNPDYINKASNKKFIELMHRVVYICNIGDCQAVIISSLNAKTLSCLHSLNNLDEYDRVNQSGGLIINHLLSGKTSLTRAVGDHKLKVVGMISTPHITKVKVTQLDKWIILGSHGVFTVLKESDLFRMSHNMKTSLDFGEGIKSMILNRGCKENMSFYVIGLKDDYCF